LPLPLPPLSLPLCFSGMFFLQGTWGWHSGPNSSPAGSTRLSLGSDKLQPQSFFSPTCCQSQQHWSPSLPPPDTWSAGRELHMLKSPPQLHLMSESTIDTTPPPCEHKCSYRGIRVSVHVKWERQKKGKKPIFHAAGIKTSGRYRICVNIYCTISCSPQ
jgi:hypothetical protein